MVAGGDPGQKVVEVAERNDGEERDIDGVVEDQCGSGDQTPQVAQPSQREILTAAGQWVGGRYFRIAEADQGKDDACREEGQGCKSEGCEGDDAQRRVNVGADRRVAPHVGAIYRDIAAKLATGDRVRGVRTIRRRLHSGSNLPCQQMEAPRS